MDIYSTASGIKLIRWTSSSRKHQAFILDHAHTHTPTRAHTQSGKRSHARTHTHTKKSEIDTPMSCLSSQTEQPRWAIYQISESLGDESGSRGAAEEPARTRTGASRGAAGLRGYAWGIQEERSHHIPWSGDSGGSSRCTEGTLVAAPNACPCSWNP